MRLIPLTAMLLAACAVPAPARAQVPDPFERFSAAELAWKDGDDAGSFVSRIRETAAAMGGDCEADRRNLAALADGLQVDADGSGTAGKPFAVGWRAAASGSGTPAWLVVSADGPVRFTGAGYYALTPGAIASFGIEDGREGARAVVALFGEGTPPGGTLGIVPLRAGPLTITTHVAGFVRRCGEDWSRTIASHSVPVAVSAEAVFSVRDPFSFDAPRQVIASPDGASSVERFDDRYRLIDRETGAVLLDREGREPRYSPTGRFLVTQVDEDFELIDVADGTVVASGPSGDIAWENADSFMVVGQPASGTVVVRNTLLEGSAREATLDCTACPGMTTRLTIDLENDLLLRIGGQGYAIGRLGAGSTDRTGMIDMFDEEIMAEAAAVIAADGNAMAAAPMLIPEHWNLRGGARFSRLAEDYQPTGNGAFDAWLDRMKTALQPVVEEVERVPSPDRLRPVEIGQGRGAASLGRPKVVRDRMPMRLEEFGIASAQPIRPVFTKAGQIDDRQDQEIASRIEATVPWARGLFLPKDFGCLPEDGAKLYAAFDQAAEFRIGDRSVWLTLFSCKWTANGAFEPNFYLFDSAAQSLIRLGGANPRQPNSGRCDSGIAACAFEAALFGQRHLLIWSRASQAFLLYDLDAHQVVVERYGLGRGELLREARLSTSGDTVIQFNADDSFFVYDTTGAAQLLEGRYVDDEIIAWSPDLRFDSTAEGANYVALRFPGQPGEFTFQQYRRQLQRPGHVREVIGRRHRPGQTALRIPPALSGSIEARDDRLRGSLHMDVAREPRLYQDGLLTDTLPVEPGATEAALEVQRVAGARWVSVVATGPDGLVSRPLGRELPAPTGSPGKVHLLTVGVDRYSAPGLIDLRFAGADARTLRDAFSALDGKSLTLGINEQLVDEAARPDAILARARRIVAAAGKGETIVFSFAGHGVTDSQGRFYMATSDTDPASISTSALAWTDLVDVLKSSRARVVVFLDACHSGAAGTGFFATNDEAAQGLLDQIPSGLLVFSASKGRQLSEEVARLGGGVFTNAVADIIARERAAYDLDANGAIEASELYAGVKRRVSELTDGRQVPWLARNELIGDFALF